jgi:hypothetical protein
MHDEVMVIDHAAGELVECVGSAVTDVPVGPRDAFLRGPTALRSSLHGGQCPLGTGKALRGALAVPTVRDQVPVTGGHEHGHPDVDADLTAGRGERLGGDIYAPDTDPPALSFALDRDGLGGSSDRAVQANLERTNPLQV